MRKTGRKWNTDRCGRCGRMHEGYSGKLDQFGVEYVVCGVTNKRMNVSEFITDKASLVFATIWTESVEIGK